MYLFHNRPLGTACCILAICALLISQVNRTIGIVLLSIGALLLLIFISAFLHRRCRTWLLAVICTLAAVIAILHSFVFFHVRYPSYQEYVDKECVIEGTVLKRVRSGPYQTLFYVALDSIDGKRERVDVMLECTYASSMQAGERFRITARGRAFETKSGYDEEATALSGGMVLALVCEKSDDCTIFDDKVRSPRAFFSEWNASAAFRLENMVGGRAGKLCSAFLLGNRDGLNSDESLAFERAGVSHLLALSGLHISILIMIVEWLLRQCCCPRLGRVLTVSVLAIFYLFLTGASLSTARAVCMLCVLTVAYCLQESYDSFTGLCAALAFLILLMPYAVLDIGMWMSFIAAGAIIIFTPIMRVASERFSKKVSLPRFLHKMLFGVLGALFVGLVANLALAYLQAVVFGRISLLSLPATMLLSIPLTLTLIFSVLALLLPPFGTISQVLADLMLKTTAWLSDFENVLLPTNDLLTRSVLFVLTLVLIFLAVAKLKRMIWCILPLTLAVLAVTGSVAVTRISYGKLNVERLPGAKGEILLLTQAGDAVAVTYAAETAGGAHTLFDGLEAARCTELDDLVMTHYYHQSTYFLSTLAGEIKIRNLRLPPPTNEQEEGIALRLSEEAEKRGIRVFFHLNGLALTSSSIEALPWKQPFFVCRKKAVFHMLLLERISLFI